MVIASTYSTSAKAMSAISVVVTSELMLCIIAPPPMAITAMTISVTIPAVVTMPRTACQISIRKDMNPPNGQRGERPGGPAVRRRLLRDPTPVPACRELRQCGIARNDDLRLTQARQRHRRRGAPVQLARDLLDRGRRRRLRE